MKIEILRIDRKNISEEKNLMLEWEAFVYNNLYGSIFQSIQYAKIFNSNFMDWILYVMLSNKTIVGGMLSTVWPRQLLPLFRFSTMKTTYGPILNEKFSTRQKREVLHSLFKEVVKERCMEHIVLSMQPLKEISEYKYVLQKGEIIGTLVLDLEKPTEILWKNLEKRTRYAIKQARRYNFTIKGEYTNISYKIYHLLHTQTCKRLGTAPNPQVFYKQIQDTLRPKFATFLIAYSDEIPVAGIILLKYRDTVYYYSSAMLPEYRHTQVMSLLLWKAITLSKEEGFKYFDFLFYANPYNPSNRESGLYLFKRGFGGVNKEIYHYIYTKSRIGEIIWKKIATSIYIKTRNYFGDKL